MFERMTEHARRVVVLAQEEALRLNHSHIGTEHILLGLLNEAEGIGAQALLAQGFDLAMTREKVQEIVGEGESRPAGHIPFTRRAKKTLELSLREALQLGHNYIGTEHILLGLLRQNEGMAHEILVQLGADLPATRSSVVERLGVDPQSATISAVRPSRLRCLHPDEELVVSAAFGFRIVRCSICGECVGVLPAA